MTSLLLYALFPRVKRKELTSFTISKNKDELLVEYATYGMDSNLFVSKYELYLPNRTELEKLVKDILDDEGN